MANVRFVIMYAMIIFVIFHDLHVDEYGNRQDIWLSIFLCDLRVIESSCNCFTLSLRVAIVVVAIVGGDKS